jgi:[ribosomal protein S5]-alanine N-acetyltransferase
MGPSLSHKRERGLLCRNEHAHEHRNHQALLPATASLGCAAAIRVSRRPDGDAVYHCDASLRQCRRRIAVHERRRRSDGCAPWAVVTKTDGRVVGWGGLYNDPFDPGWGVEVGYSFHPAVWGRGYATELVMVCLEFADRTLALPPLIAFAKLGNVASRRVLEKTGFTPVRFVPEMDRLLYRRERSTSGNVPAA